VRNDDLLECQFPLLINMPDDELANWLKDKNPHCQLSYYDSNYEYHIAHKANRLNLCQFSAHYQTKLSHDLVIISFPKSKNELAFTLAQLAHCTTEDSRILVVGENKSGIKSLNKLVQQQSDYCEKIDNARHCLLFEIRLNNHQQEFRLEDWFTYYTVTQSELSFKIAALPGVFSQAKLDIGTSVLLENLSQPVAGKILDFGCGAGVIACFIGLKNPDAELHLADVSALALTSSKKSLAINHLHGKTIATNSLSSVTEQYQYVISNPPFHQGVKTHYQATEQFLARINQHMTSNGQLTVVANSFLKYQPIMENAFGKVHVLSAKRGFTVYQTKKG